MKKNDNNLAQGNGHKASAESKAAENKPNNGAASKTVRNNRPKTTNGNGKTKKTEAKSSFRVIPLGGLGEIGKNFTLFECGNDIIIVDCGIKFPDSDMPGIDFIIPDFSYLDDKVDRVRGLFLTHGHEDHIGAITFFIKRFENIQIYGTKLTIGLLGRKITEHGLEKKCQLNVVHYKSTITVKGFTVEFVVTNHSIADSAALFIKCEAGTIFHTGDFKIDLTPVDNQHIDLSRMAQIGKEGVDLMLCDSTNAERKGYTPSESTVGESFMYLFEQASKKRIVVATFATNIHRIQQVFDTARHYKRKVAISGRSMSNVIAVAKELKYLKFKDSLLIDLKEVNNYLPEQLVLLTTGSQGEPLSALSRMASGEHRQLKITEDDYVIISATPIPGNEKTVAYIISDLMKLGADVIYQGASDVHVSGHACQEEIKILLTLLKPKNYMPCHGEYKMLAQNAKLAMRMGISKENIFIMENGDVLEISDGASKVTGSVPVGITLVDGKGIGDIGNTVLKERKRLSEDGLLLIAAGISGNELVSGPDIVTRGFVYMKESEDLIGEARDICYDRISAGLINSDINTLKNDVRREVETFLFNKTNRRPIVVTVFMNMNKEANNEYI